MDNSLTDGLSQELLYDLRQIYAVEILGEHLKDIMRARKHDNYHSYFKCLKDTWIVVRHKVKKKDKEKVTEDYLNLMGKAVELINKYPHSFTGSNPKMEDCAQIENILNEVEIFLYEQIEEAGIFGKSQKIPGL